MGTLKNSKLTIKNSNEFPCSYIDGRSERRVLVNIPNSKIGNEVISELTKKGFRRNYDHMYIPSCRSCNSCISSRINIFDFVFSKSNKRNLKNNIDLFLVEKKEFTEERFELFKNYCKIRHADGQMKDMTQKEFINFFHSSTNKTKIFDLENFDKKLYGSILVDVIEGGYSAVYSLFDPYLKKRGLGKTLILKMIQRLKVKKRNYLYLGYWIKESNSMNYKSSFNNVEYYINGKWKEAL